jgi:hypothetical protein
MGEAGVGARRASSASQWQLEREVTVAAAGGLRRRSWRGR